MNKQEKRRIKLLNMLQIHRKLDVKTVSSSLNISEATARRLFSSLESENKVIRIHGGVQLAPEISHDYSYQLSARSHVREKTLIGTAASRYVETGDSIFLDSGSTVFKFAESLSIRIQTDNLSNIVVLTNSLDLVNVLGNQCKIILIGGEARLERRDVCGSIAEKTLNMFKVSKAFFGADGIDLESGFMTTDERTANMNGIVLRRAKEAYVLADSSKFNHSSFITYANFDEIHSILSDPSLCDDLIRSFTAAGAVIRKAEI